MKPTLKSGAAYPGLGLRKALLKLNRLFRWIADISHWLAEGKIVFMGTLVLVAVVTLGIVTWRSELSLRLTGYVLQVIGMIMAIRGLLSIRAHFGQPFLRQLFVNWLKRVPKWKKSVVVDAGAGHVAMMGMKARAEVWTPDNPDQPIENRIKGLIKNLEGIRKEQGEHSESIEALRDSYEKNKKKVMEESKNMEEKIRSDLESLHTSDIITSLVGLIWLTVGISMSTMAPELYKWLQ